MKTNEATVKNSSSKKTSSDTANTKSKSNKKTDPKVAQGLRDLFEDSLKDIYYAEKALTKAMPKMLKNATSQELKSALEEHLVVTKNQVLRLEEIFQILGKAARAKKCEAIEGLIKEGEGIMEDTEEGVVRDAGIIAASQKIEHYEIATYGTLCAFARILGEDEAVGLLEETLAEEKEADTLLTNVAETSVNLDAAENEMEEEEEA